MDSKPEYPAGTRLRHKDRTIIWIVTHYQYSRGGLYVRTATGVPGFIEDRTLDQYEIINGLSRVLDEI